jgi:hypothetical protein
VPSGSVLAKTLRSLGGVKFDYKDFLAKPTTAGGSHQHILKNDFEKMSCRLNEMALLDLLILQQVSPQQPHAHTATPLACRHNLHPISRPLEQSHCRGWGRSATD